MKYNKNNNLMLYLIGIIPVLWIALLISPYINGGIVEIIKEFPKIIDEPLKLTFCAESIRVSFFFMLIYIFGISMYESTKKNYRRKEEQGSAKWGDAKSINKKYKQKPQCDNKILTKNVAIGLDGKKHKRNLNVLVVGGSGAGKTFTFCKPNLMQCGNTSYVVLDPKRRCDLLQFEKNCLSYII